MVDPDIALHGGYPRGRACLLRRFGKNLAGRTGLEAYAHCFSNPAINRSTRVARRPPDDTSEALRPAARRDRCAVVVSHAGAPLAFLALGGPRALGKHTPPWTQPPVTVIQPVLRLQAELAARGVLDAAEVRPLRLALRLVIAERGSLAPAARGGRPAPPWRADQATVTRAHLRLPTCTT